jgi:hypothetical protein
MAITEKSRHELYRRLEEILGPDQATTLMEHLPPVGWADVATKDDLHQLETRLEAKIEVLASDLRAELHSTLRTNAFLIIGAIATLVAMSNAIVALT